MDNTCLKINYIHKYNILGKPKYEMNVMSTVDLVLIKRNSMKFANDVKVVKGKAQCISDHCCTRHLKKKKRGWR